MVSFIITSMAMFSSDIYLFLLYYKASKISRQCEIYFSATDFLILTGVIFMI